MDLSFFPEYFNDAFIDAVKDSVSLIPFLFVIFVFIEVFEQFFSHKINAFLRFSKGIGPIIGTLAAIVPQCGFSVIASTLYIRRFISVGTLLAVYIATSDEAIPILLADHSQLIPMLKIILIKCVMALIVGYSVDFILSKTILKDKKDEKPMIIEEHDHLLDNEKGCCGHAIKEKKRVKYLLHPLLHTLRIWAFIFVVCLTLNCLFEHFGLENIQNHMLQNSPIQPIITGIIGLIPNCAISVLITTMFINGVISLGSTVAGLSSSAGLGLLVLIRRNKSIKNTLFVIGTLLTVSIVAGILIQLFA